MPNQGLVHASMRVRVRVKHNEAHVRLWLYADRLAVSPAVMDEISYRWVYPRQRAYGGIKLSDVRVDGSPARLRYVRYPAGHERSRDASGGDALVELPPGPARIVSVSLRFRLVVPARFGRLGRAGDALALLAPWYPLVVGQNDCWDYDVPHHIQLSLASGYQAWAAQRRVQGAAELQAQGSYLPVFMARRIHVQPLGSKGRRTRYIASSAPYRAPEPEAQGIWGLRDLLKIDVPRRVERVLRDVELTLRASDLPPPDPPAVVRIPTRVELTSLAGSTVVVSDRLFEVLPFKVARAFHERALRRALFRHAALELFGAKDGAADRGWAADLRAVLLADLDDSRRAGKRLRPDQILAAVSFHPIVDQLLYAPQIPFEDVYFGAVAERDVFRDDPVHSRLLLARGRRLLEAARDAMRGPEFKRFAGALLDRRLSVREALAQAAPRLEPRLDQWLAAPRLLTNYKLLRFGSKPLATGGFEHRVEILREGAAVVEPVEVLAIDGDGRELRGRWRGSGQRGTVTLRSQAPLDRVQIDPRRRLTQDPRATQGHPYADDANWLPWRPPLVQWWDVKYLPGGKWQGFADFALRRRYDLEHTIAGTINGSPRWTGARALYVESFGPKVHTNRRPLSAGAGLEFRRLWPSGDAGGGYRFAALAQLKSDTISFIQDPRRGYYVKGDLSLGFVRGDDGALGPLVAAGLRSALLVPLGLRNVTFLLGGADLVAGKFLPADRPDLADGFVLRGFEFGEALGDARLYAAFEHRWTAVAGLDWNLFQLGWVREIQLAAFGAGGMLVNPVSIDPTEMRKRRLRGHAEVGAGLHLQVDWGGFQRGLARFSLAVPLTRTPAEKQGRAPVGLQIALEQLY
ncbi:MAG: hypothetical protein MJD61_22745 [Proteobacteria bacterium]|nr:hypothetical protein [Pseudomonadota bacterium]